MVYDGKLCIRITIMNHANLKKACEFQFLELDGSQELTSCHCTFSYTRFGVDDMNARIARLTIVYCNTSDVDRLVLAPELAGFLPDCKILVNEVLSSTDFTRYLLIKDSAKY